VVWYVVTDLADDGSDLREVNAAVPFHDQHLRSHRRTFHCLLYGKRRLGFGRAKVQVKKLERDRERQSLSSGSKQLIIMKKSVNSAAVLTTHAHCMCFAFRGATRYPVLRPYARLTH
jgi:hypothetical protein